MWAFFMYIRQVQFIGDLVIFQLGFYSSKFSSPIRLSFIGNIWIRNPDNIITVKMEMGAAIITVKIDVGVVQSQITLGT